AAQVTCSPDDLALFLHRGDHRVSAARVELGGVRTLQSRHVPRVLDHHALQSQAQAERGNLVLPRVPDRADLAFDTSDPEATRDADRVDVGELLRSALRSGAGVRGNPANVDFGVVVEATRTERLGDREVGVRQVD